MVNLSLKRGVFIKDWKLSVVKVLIKKINLGTEFKNHRPISNLSFITKIVEKVVQYQLTDHFNRQSLIPIHQNAYRKFYSTETTILDLYDNILVNMENNEKNTYGDS